MAIRLSVDVAGLLFVVSVLASCRETGLQFSEEPQSLIVLKNHAALLNCSAIGASDDEDITISWRKNGVDIVPDRRVSIMMNGSLYFRRIVHNLKRHLNDQGKYECVATNRIGALVSRQAFLQVADLNHFSGQPLSTSVTVGDTTHFGCQIKGLPEPSVVWEKNAEPLTLSERYVVLPSYSLLIYNASEEDAGIYRCRAENIAGERFSKNAELVVNRALGVDGEQSQPRILLGPTDQQVTAGEKVLLECTTTHGSGGLQPLIGWSRKDGLPLPSERIRVIGHYNMEILDVQESDAGVYICSLPDWPDVTAVEAMLTVLVAPRPVGTSENIVRPTAHTVRMTCEFEGVPTPSVTWLKDGEQVKSNGRIKIKGDLGTLLISQSTARDSGLYQCWAENGAGRAGMIIRLFIEPSDFAPAPPTALRASTLSSRSIELSWEISPPKNGLNTMAYSVHYLLSNGGPELQKVVEEPHTIIEQLQPNAAYMFYVVAYNERSASQHSEPITQMTLEDVPTSAPEIQVFEAGANALKVQWEELPPDKARGIIAKYQIFYRKHGQEIPDVSTVDGPTNQYSINGLETGVTYKVRVLAGTQVGFPTLSDDQWPWVSKTVTSSIDVGVTNLTNVQFVVVNATTIHLFWDLPTNITSPLLGFKITYKVHGSPEEAKMIYLVDVTNHPIHQLKPDTVYEISISPFTDLGDGYHVTKNVRTFPDGIVHEPPVPTAITAEPLNETSCLLTWSEPEFKDGTVTHFTVRYLPVLSDGHKPTANASVTDFLERISQTSQIVITNLSPFAVYQFTVQSHTSSTDSQLSQEVRCQTKEGCPGIPQNVAVFLVAPTDIEVNWQPPKISNGVITSYIVYYSDEKTAPISKWLTQVENGTVKTALIAGLKPNTLYSIKVQAMTHRCEGLYSATVDLLTREVYHMKKSENANTRGYSDRTLGIVIGICISGGCIVICVLLVAALRNRPLPCTRGRQTMHDANGYAAQVQDGRPVSSPLLRFNVATTDNKDMDRSSHILNKSQGNEHLDSKGGPVIMKCKENGDVAKMNGFTDYSRQNGGATQSLLSQQKLNESETTVAFKVSSNTSPPEDSRRQYKIVH